MGSKIRQKGTRLWNRLTDTESGLVIAKEAGSWGWQAQTASPSGQQGPTVQQGDLFQSPVIKPQWKRICKNNVCACVCITKLLSYTADIAATLSISYTKTHETGLHAGICYLTWLCMWSCGHRNSDQLTFVCFPSQKEEDIQYTQSDMLQIRAQAALSNLGPNGEKKTPFWLGVDENWIQLQNTCLTIRRISHVHFQE